MITEIKIENFKSLHDLTLNVGRFNILIGENGSGKSNILEAITLAAAAEANKLDNEFLSSRGIRVTDPHFMRSAFSDESKSLPIKITVSDKADNISNEYLLTNDNKAYSKWTVTDNSVIDASELISLLKRVISNENNFKESIKLKLISEPDTTKTKYLSEHFKELTIKISDFENLLKLVTSA